MFIRYILILNSFLIFTIVTGCKKDSAPTQIQEQPTQIEKSPKRGLAYNLTEPADFDTLKSGVSWWYNWYYKTSARVDYYSNYQMEFVPMLWGRNSAGDFAAQQRTIYLVGPAMSWGTMTNYWDPVVWLDAFYSAYKSANAGREPKIDYLAFHWYDYGLESQLDRLKKYGKKIWITEMANWNSQINSYEKQAQQMRQMVSICESRDDVFRYAWFIGRGNYPDKRYTYLFNPSPGQLNALGNLYISLPYSK